MIQEIRLQDFLELPEYEHSNDENYDCPVGSISIINACMAWEILSQKTSKEEYAKTSELLLNLLRVM